MTPQSIKVIILCSWGATSSLLALKVQKAANKRELKIAVHSGGTLEFKQKAGEYNVALLEPQIRHLMKEIKETAAPHHLPVALIDQQAFALMDGDKVLNQVLNIIK